MVQKAIRVSLIYLVISALLGMFMGISHNFSVNLVSVHSHLMFLGWILFTLIGIIYYIFPAAGETPLAKWAFIVQNFGLVVWMIGVLLEIADQTRFEVVAGLGAAISVIGIILFSINIWKGVNKEKARPIC